MLDALMTDSESRHCTAVRQRHASVCGTLWAPAKCCCGVAESLTVSGHSVKITVTRDGRPSGMAFVEFASPKEAEVAMSKVSRHIPHVAAVHLGNRAGN